MPKKTAPSPAAAAAGSIPASVRTVTVQAGLYLFSVRAGTPAAKPVSGLRLPALHVGTGPGVPTARVEFIPNNAANGNWLAAAGDLLVIRVHAPGALLVMSSVRAAGGPELAITFERLQPQPASKTAAKAAPAPKPGKRTLGGLRLQVGAHIRNRGDVKFEDADWAGRLGNGLWIESFSVTPLEKLTPQDIEYKGLTASGFESPWLTNGVACGTRGLATPLLGFAIRMKGGAATEYDCEYSGYFQSGVVVGPLRNGTPCRSTAPNDALEGLQIRIVRRGGEAEKAAPKRAAKKPPKAKPARKAARRKP